VKLADRLRRLGTETAFEVLARARALEAQGREIIHLQIGEPDFDTPKPIVDEAIRALEAGETHYTPSAGTRELRETVAGFLKRRRGVPATPDGIVITPGGKPVLFYALLACTNPGDEVILPDPGYPIYESVTSFFGAKAVPVPLREENDFRLDPDELRSLVTDRTRLIILNSPHNPTGSVLTREDLVAVADISRERDIWVLADEIYCELIYEGEHHSIASLPGMADRTIIADGWSKCFAMTGWRLGFGCMPEELARHMARLMTNNNSCAAAFTQKAGRLALEDEKTWQEVERMRKEFHRRRDALVGGLNDIDGVSCRVPRGAFYAFPNIRKLGVSSQALADYLLKEAGVAVLSGTSFGAQGEGYLRFSYANSMENIQAALRKMKEGLARLPVELKS
jgi:aspartate aminotransferase